MGRIREKEIGSKRLGDRMRISLFDVDDKGDQRLGQIIHM